tara:strand:+ start:31773 stop:32030 length:258 start_codon:yes stop_codon:yes gene_type:complete
MQELVDEETELEPFEDFYLRSFWHLCTEKMGGPAIPHSKIREYGEREGLDSAMIGAFTSVIWSLDRAHANWSETERERIRKMNNG